MIRVYSSNGVFSAHASSATGLIYASKYVGRDVDKDAGVEYAGWIERMTYALPYLS